MLRRPAETTIRGPRLTDGGRCDVVRRDAGGRRGGCSTLRHVVDVDAGGVGWSADGGSGGSPTGRPAANEAELLPLAELDFLGPPVVVGRETSLPSGARTARHHRLVVLAAPVRYGAPR